MTCEKTTVPYLDSFLCCAPWNDTNIGFAYPGTSERTLVCIWRAS